MKFAVIHSDQSTPVEIRETDLKLADMQEIVGGYIERVIHQDKGLELWFNEEGKLAELPHNNKATMIAHHGRAIFPQDYIAGPCIVTASTDGEGDHLPLDDVQVAWLEGLDKVVRDLADRAS